MPIVSYKVIAAFAVGWIAGATVTSAFVRHFLRRHGRDEA